MTKHDRHLKQDCFENLDEDDAIVKPQYEFVEKLQMLEQILVRLTSVRIFVVMTIQQ